MVVPTYRFSQSEHALPDAECAYRYGRQIAGDHGGNLGLPVTMFGHSYGASMSLWIGLDEGALGPGGDYLECFEGTDRPNVIVGVAGSTTSTGMKPGTSGSRHTQTPMRR